MNKNYIILLFAVLAFLGCQKKSYLETLIPEEMGVYELDGVEKNTENIFQQFDPENNKPVEVILAKYTSEQSSAKLYLSNYKDTLTAISIFHHTMRSLKADTINYKHVVPRFNQDLFFIMAIKNNQMNYFFTKGSVVYWLICDKNNSEQAIKDLISYNR